jgi:hypothetical protein
MPFKSNRELFDVALNTMNLEISLFWQRSNYFLILNTAISTGTLLKFSDQNDLSLILTVFGML